MKTLHLTNAWHESSGGIAAFYRALIEEANRRGHEICLVVPGEVDRTEEIGPHAKIYYVQSRLAPLNSRYRMIFPGQFLRAGSALQRIVAAERPDLVEICDKYTLTYFGALLRRGLLKGMNLRPVVVGLSCERMQDNFRVYIGRVPFAGAFCAAYMKWLYFPFFDHHIANSAYTAEELRAASRGHSITRSVWVRPMGVDTGSLSSARKSRTERQRLLQLCGGGEKSALLAYTGRLAPEKNLSLLFGTLVRLVARGERDYRLLVAGDGIERARWEEFCRKRVPGCASFLGHVKGRDEFASLLANADVFVHPNPREPFGIAPLEALAAGLPLVAPDRGGVLSYANSTNAWLANPDVGSFAQSIEDALANDDLRRARIEAGLETAARLRWENVVPQFLDLYAELHGAAMENGGECPDLRPAFTSTPLSGWRLGAFHTISQAAERTFRWAARALPKSNVRVTEPRKALDH